MQGDSDILQTLTPSMSLESSTHPCTGPSRRAVWVGCVGVLSSHSGGASLPGAGTCPTWGRPVPSGLCAWMGVGVPRPHCWSHFRMENQPWCDHLMAEPKASLPCHVDERGTRGGR